LKPEFPVSWLGAPFFQKSVLAAGAPLSPRRSSNDGTQVLVPRLWPSCLPCPCLSVEPAEQAFHPGTSCRSRPATATSPFHPSDGFNLHFVMKSGALPCRPCRGGPVEPVRPEPYCAVYCARLADVNDSRNRRCASRWASGAVCVCRRRRRRRRRAVLSADVGRERTAQRETPESPPPSPPEGKRRKTWAAPRLGWQTRSLEGQLRVPKAGQVKLRRTQNLRVGRGRPSVGLGTDPRPERTGRTGRTASRITSRVRRKGHKSRQRSIIPSLEMPLCSSAAR